MNDKVQDMVTPEIGTPEFLESCIEERRKEVISYQFNIDNYTLAIRNIEGDADRLERQSDFLDNLRKLLKGEKVQQERSQIMLEVLIQRST